MKLFIFFWGLLIFSSIAWYALLLFYIGYKGGREIKQMANNLSERNSKQQ